MVIDNNLQFEASIDLPKVHVSAEYIQDEARGPASAVAPDGSVISQGSYLSAEAEIGHLEHCLTTDLLNHLVFVQNVGDSIYLYLKRASITIHFISLSHFV